MTIFKAKINFLDMNFVRGAKLNSGAVTSLTARRPAGLHCLSHSSVSSSKPASTSRQGLIG